MVTLPLRSKRILLPRCAAQAGRSAAAVGQRGAELLAQVFRADLEHCPRCGGPMRWAEVATGEAVVALLIEHGLVPRAPAPVCPAPLGQLELPFAG